MLNKLAAFLQAYAMVQPGDRVICALSGGADSVAMTFGLWLLRDKLGIVLEAAHFNHGLRGSEADADEAFVREFCSHWQIPLHLGAGTVTPGKKGLEAAARQARYDFLGSLPGKIATAHTADDNAETLLLHLIRGTGLRGLGGIAPVSGAVIRPMLSVTRREVEDFCSQWSLPFVTDSTNLTDDFQRNRLRRHVMPLLARENPRLAESLSATALRLRLDEEYIRSQTPRADGVDTLRSLPPALQSRALEALLKDNGVPEPGAEQIALARALAESANPSARGQFPGGVTLGRQYDRLVALDPREPPAPAEIACPGVTELPQWGIRVTCRPAQPGDPQGLQIRGGIRVTSRLAGDAITLPGGTKSLKKLFIDRKIPANERNKVPVLRDAAGVLLVGGFGPNRSRLSPEPGAFTICAEPL